MKPMRKNVMLLSLCQAMMLTGNSLITTTSALVGFALAEDKSFATLPLALQFFASMCTTIPASLLMSRIGRRAGFQLGVTLGILGALLSSYAIYNHHFPGFCLGALLIGTFNGFAIFYRLAAVDNASPEYRPRAIAYVLAGGVVASFLGPNLARLSIDWIPSATFAGSYLALTSVYIVSMLALAGISIPRPPQHAGIANGRPLLQIARQPRFIVAVLGAMLGYSTMSLIMTATPLTMKDLTLPFADIAFVIQWHVFAMFAPSFVTGTLINRFGVLNIMLAGVALNVLCVVLNLSGQSLPHIWIALFSLGVGWNFLFVGGTTLLTETYRVEERAKTQAINDFLVVTMVTVAVLSAGSLKHHFGWLIVNLSALPLILIILLAVIWLLRTEKTRPAPAAGDHGDHLGSLD